MRMIIYLYAHVWEHIAQCAIGLSNSCIVQGHKWSCSIWTGPDRWNRAMLIIIWITRVLTMCLSIPVAPVRARGPSVWQTLLLVLEFNSLPGSDVWRSWRQHATGRGITFNLSGRHSAQKPELFISALWVRPFGNVCVCGDSLTHFTDEPQSWRVHQLLQLLQQRNTVWILWTRPLIIIPGADKIYNVYIDSVPPRGADWRE